MACLIVLSVATLCSDSSFFCKQSFCLTAFVFTATMTARDRSRSPMFQEGDSETAMMLKMMDKIRALEQTIKGKNMTIANLNEECRKVPLYADFIKVLKGKIQTLNARAAQLEHNPQLPCSLPTLTRAALDVVYKHDGVERLEEQRILIDSQRHHIVQLREELRQMSLENANLKSIMQSRGISINAI